MKGSELTENEYDGLELEMEDSIKKIVKDFKDKGLSHGEIAKILKVMADTYDPESPNIQDPLHGV